MIIMTGETGIAYLLQVGLVGASGKSNLFLMVGSTTIDIVGSRGISVLALLTRRIGDTRSAIDQRRSRFHATASLSRARPKGTSTHALMARGGFVTGRSIEELEMALSKTGFGRRGTSQAFGFGGALGCH
jgi:hypothetical protein